MIQHHYHLESQIELFNNLSQRLTGHVQKIYSTSRFICITLRFPGKTRYLYLGRGGGTEGVWEGEDVPESALRVRDRLLEYLRSHFIGGAIDKLLLDKKDRILMLPYFKNSKDNAFAFFWQGRLLYFLHQYFTLEDSKWHLFCSWCGEKELEHGPLSDEELFACFEGRAELQEESKKSGKLVPLSELLKQESKLIFEGKEKTKKLKYLERKLLNVENDLEKNQKYKELQKIVIKEDFSIDEGANEIKLAGLVFKFDRHFSFFQKREKIFEKIKRLKSGLVILQERQDECLKQIEELKSGKNAEKNIVLSRPKIISPVWGPVQNGKSGGRSHGKAHVSTNTNIWEAVFKENIKCAIGKNDIGNDFLRNSWASKEDYWLHLEGFKSAHAIIKISSTSMLDDELLKLVGSAIASMSGLEIRSVPLIFTQVKNVKGIKGKPGLVTYKKEKHRMVDYVPEWKGHFRPN